MDIFPRFSDEIKFWLTEPVPGGAVGGDVKITRTRCGKYFMHVPTKVPWGQLPGLAAARVRKIVALDPGVREFQTAYSPEDGTASFNTLGRLRDEAEKCDDLIGELQQRMKYPKRRRLKEAISRSRLRAKNLVTELHNGVAHWLCTNYDTVLLPTFESQNMVKKDRGPGRRRKIRAKTARELLNLSHYKFRERLAGKAVMTGTELCVVSEGYTTQNCGKCGLLNPNVGSSETFRCADRNRCGFVCGRDENAARNIFLKYLRYCLLFLLVARPKFKCSAPTDPGEG